MLIPSVALANDTALSVENTAAWRANPLVVEPIPEPPQSLRKRVAGGDTSITTLRDFIRLEAENNQIDPNLAEAIVRAESNWVWDARNPIGTASGLWQWLDSSWLHFCSDTLENKLDPIEQTDCALRILKEPAGEKHWESSRYGKSGWGQLANF